MIFDGDCGFCRLWILRWRSITTDRVEYAPSQQVAARFPEIPPEAFARSVQLVLPSGEVFEGAEAVFRALARVPGRGIGLWLYRKVPGVRPLTESAYRFIARHRSAALRVTRALWGARMEKPTYALASALFLKLVGICYFAAFVSLWVQADGLIGSGGILPVARFLEWARSQSGSERYWLLPTLCWLDASDGFLHLLCGTGSLASLLLIAGMAPAVCLALCWAAYLSLSVAGQTFLEFQWDLLLLETGFLAIFLAPPALSRRIARASPISSTALLLLRWLLFRLMFSSGAVKLVSGDPTWRNLTALQYHYETQPLPPWTAWFLHQLPPSFHRFSALLLFSIELAVPFLIVAPRRLRLFAAATMAGLQILIAASGNYAFFNLLAIALCLLLVDDAAFPERARRGRAGQAGAPGRAWPRGLTAALAASILLVSAIQFGETLGLRVPWPVPVLRLARLAVPFRSVNSYGLFAVMTTIRPEIVLEGSNDATGWLPYEFRWKPGDPLRRPGFVAPHQPRLDWQMWFAALGSYETNHWFLEFAARLLRGSPDVRRLLAKDPFPKRPPRYLRAVLYRYRFTDFKTLRRTGAWWRRERVGLYCPLLSLEALRQSAE